MKIHQFILTSGVALAIAACATKSSPTGFLNDYSKLKPNPFFADLAWVAPDADFSKYDSMIIDPVVVYGERAAALPEAERNNLANQLRNSFVRRMGSRFNIVDSTGPSTLRLRMALSDVDATSPKMNTVTTVLPQARLIGEAQRMATGTQNFAGSTAMEAEFLDSSTGKQIAAGVDRQFGKKRLSTSASKWGEVRKIFDTWANEMTNNLIAHQNAHRR